MSLVGVRGLVPQDADAVHLSRWLRRGGARRGDETEGQARDERPPVHHSITWSARWRSDGGIVRPRAFAVLRLMTSSSLVTCSTGRSAGLAPRGRFFTKGAARRTQAPEVWP